MQIFQRLTYYCVLLLFIQALAGCAVKPFVLDKAADALAIQGQSDEDDIVRVQDDFGR